MNLSTSATMDAADPTDDVISRRTTELFKEQQQGIIVHTDLMFSWLMICQWFFAVGLAERAQGVE